MQNEEFFKYKDNFITDKKIKSILIHGNLNHISHPKITIAIPTYKRPECLKQAVDSVLNQINYNDFEIIIIDNEANFTDESINIQLIKQYNNPRILYYINEENIGMFGNWNRCIQLARGEYITILNDDDWLEENFLSISSKFLIDNCAIYTQAKNIDLRKNKSNSKDSDKLLLIKEKIKKLNLMDFFFYNWSPGSLGILFKTDKLIELGGYNKDYYPSSDYILHANYIREFGGLYIYEQLSNYRIEHNESLNVTTAIKWQEIDYYFRIYLFQYFKISSKILYKFVITIQCNQINSLENKWGIKVNQVNINKGQRFILSRFISLRNIIKSI